MDDKPQPTVIPSIADKVANAANIAAIDRLIQASRYSYIIAWGKWLGFTPETVQASTREAEADDAPLDAIQKVEGRWLVLGDIQNDANRKRVEEIANAPRAWSR
jgi:hypothetical protein